MESPIPSQLTVKPKVTTVLSKSWRVINSHRRIFRGLFFLLVLVFFTAGIGFSYPSGKASGRLSQFLTVRVLLNTLVYKILSLLATISVTSFALNSLNGKPTKDLNNGISSFFPLLATNLLQLAISFLVILGFATIFGCVVISASLLGFHIDPKTPFLPVLAITVVGVPSLLVVAYLKIVSWGMVTAVVVAESTWGFAALKRSKSLVNGNRSVAVILFLIFAASYIVVGLISKTFSAVAGLEEIPLSVAMALLSTAQVFITASMSSVVKLYDIVAITMFYVFCKAVHEEGFRKDNQYVKLVLPDYDNGSNRDGYDQVQSSH